MRIAIDASKIETQHKTGTEYYAWELITGLLRELPEDDEILLYSRNPLPAEVLELHPRALNRVIPGQFMWTLWHLSRALGSDRPDVFYTPASILPPFGRPKKSYVVIHGLEYEAFPQAYSFFRFWHLATFTLLSAKWAYKIITPSESTKKDLVSEYNVPAGKVSVIHSGVPDIQSEGGIRSEVVELAGQQYLFWIGRKEVRKNLELLVEVFDLIQADYPELQLVLAGKEGYGYADIHNLIQESPAKDRIIELGFVTDAEKQELYDHATAFVFPSWYEGFGFPILEAMRAGVPVMASTQSSLPEIGENAAVYAEPDDPAEWERELRGILDTPETRQAMIKRGHEQWKKYSFEQTVQETVDCITGP